MADDWKKLVGIKSSNDPLAKLKAQLEESKKQTKPQFNRFSMRPPQSSSVRQNRPSSSSNTTTSNHRNSTKNSKDNQSHQPSGRESDSNYRQDNRVKNFLKTTGSLSSMFAASGQKTSSSDETKLFMNLATKFSRDNMDTHNFSQEYDDSQAILCKSKKFKSEFDHKSDVHLSTSSDTRYHQAQAIHEKEDEQKTICDRCQESQPKHLIANEDSDFVYMTLLPMRPFLGTFISDVLIRSKDHSCDSLVSSTYDHQRDTEKLIEVLADCWKVHGFRIVIIETHLRNRRSNYKNFVSCNQHFEIHCLPVKEKYFERARMNFKHSLLNYGEEWSLNRKLIRIEEGRKVYRQLPQGLSYFWVCFESLDNGFAQLVEDEREFPPNFGLEILCNLLLDKEKDRNATSLNFKKESLDYQMHRANKFKNILRKQNITDVVTPWTDDSRERAKKLLIDDRQQSIEAKSHGEHENKYQSAHEDSQAS